MKITYTTRQGKKHSQEMTIERAKERLAYLDECEANTARCAPTDSGQTRFDYNREANAIRLAIA